MEQYKLQVVKVVDEFQVAPPPGTLPATLYLPLTFYDLAMLTKMRNYTFKRLFFYANPRSLDHFTQVTIPLLKSSLSVTLQHFYPFVSKLILPPVPQKPYFLFTEGDSISFIVARYTGDESHPFDYVTSDQAKDVTLLQSFAPTLPKTSVSSDGTRTHSLLAIQLTMFPDQGICIGIGFNHTLADGRTYNHFIKSWAAVCRSNCVVDIDKLVMPSFVRDSIEDPYHLESKLLKMWQQDRYSSSNERESLTYDHLYAGKVRSTFVLKQAHIEKLKHNISQYNGIVHLSSFVVACSFIWVCLIKSLESCDDDKEKVFRLYFAADMRNRLTGIQTTYFGNCITVLCAEVKRSELVAHDGLIVAAKAIGNSIKELETNGPLTVTNKWITSFSQTPPEVPLGFLLASSSPKLGLYDKNFGWGFPKKVEILQLPLPYAMSLAEGRERDGGIEIGLELLRTEMDTLTEHFYQNLDKLLCSS
ncbi:hypothetical protein ACFE04_016759 [Oxalis oulophora]